MVRNAAMSVSYLREMSTLSISTVLCSHLLASSSPCSAAPKSQHHRRLQFPRSTPETSEVSRIAILRIPPFHLTHLPIPSLSPTPYVLDTPLRTPETPWGCGCDESAICQCYSHTPRGVSRVAFNNRLRLKFDIPRRRRRGVPVLRPHLRAAVTWVCLSLFIRFHDLRC